MDFLFGKSFTTGNHEHAFGILLKKYKSYGRKAWISGTNLCRSYDTDSSLEAEHFIKYWCKYTFIHDYDTKRDVGGV